MESVFVLEVGDHEDSRIVGAFSTLEQAKKAAGAVAEEERHDQEGWSTKYGESITISCYPCNQLVGAGKVIYRRAPFTIPE